VRINAVNTDGVLEEHCILFNSDFGFAGACLARRKIVLLRFAREKT